MTDGMLSMITVAAGCIAAVLVLGLLGITAP